MDQVRELNGILDEEDRNVVANNVEVALVRVAALVSMGARNMQQVGYSVGLCEKTYNLVAKPWTSRAVSALPRDPATVENRTKVGVFLPLEPKNDAAVMLLKSS